MPSAYIPIAIFVVVATGFALFTLVVSGLISSRRYNKVKLEPYECGIEPLTDARDRYSIRYYLVAMLFVIFDVETVFMFPWAVIMNNSSSSRIETMPIAGPLRSVVLTSRSPLPPRLCVR